MRSVALYSTVFALGATLLCIGTRISASPPNRSPAPVTLTVMGKVAESNEFVEQKVFQDFSRETGNRVRFAQSLQTVSERIDLFLNLFRRRSPEPDLIELDVIWPATLGDYLMDLSPFFQNEIKDFAPELTRNFIVNGRLIAIPTFVDTGVLYYRADLLRKYGYRAAPRTWEELERMAERIQAGERHAGISDFWGYVWQGGASESLTCNALEWQSSAGGGEILGANQAVQVRNPAFLRAIRRAVSWAGTISPPGQSAFAEGDAVNFWLAGRAAFMRNWTGEYAGILHSASPMRDQTAIAALPGGVGGQRGTLGGAGTGISKYSAHPQEALELLKRIVSEQAQRERAAGGYIPSRIALRQQPEVMIQTPLHGSVADQVIHNLVARPALQAGSSYNSVSRTYYTAVHAMLTRQITPEEGIAQLERDLVKITGFRAGSAP